ncbi:MAG TPA: hypothetical protein VGU01_08235 [Sphingomicrobium sp.]|nr:hypothetical protein [Sphingomicrobium sp.]
MPDKVIAALRVRAAEARRLSEVIKNPRASDSLRKMADDLEKEARALEQESNNGE